MTDPIYAVGDLHGHPEQLERALDLIHSDGGVEAEIIFLGDLVDRGPDSRTVVETLRAGIEQGRPWHVLKGNHDRMFTRFVQSGKLDDERILSGLLWTHPRLGGLTTLASYGVDVSDEFATDRMLGQAADLVPKAHVDFLDTLPLYLERGDRLFVHAGILPGYALDLQTEDDLVWIREPFLSHPLPHPWLVVHGHTALEHPTHFGNRIDLDGGGGYGRTVHPAVFEGRDCWLLDADGRSPLRP